jgi:hypothetical protein
MTSEGIPAAQLRPGFAKIRVPLENRGRRECRVHVAPTALRANAKDARRPTQVRRNHSGTPCAMVLRLLRALPGVPGLLAPVALSISAFRPQGRNRVSIRLDPSVGGSGPHGLTVRIAPHVLRPNASIAARLTSGDEWPSRPSCRGGMASLNHNFVLSERQIFLRRALDSSGETGGEFCCFARRVAAATLFWPAGSRKEATRVVHNERHRKGTILTQLHHFDIR